MKTLKIGREIRRPVILLFIWIALTIKYNHVISKTSGSHSQPNENESVYTKRWAHVYHMCSKFGLSATLKNKGSVMETAHICGKSLNISVDDVNKIVWVRVPKAGFTSTRIFMRMLNTKNKLYESLEHEDETNRFLWQEGFRKLMFSRHPFTRILSAYKNKLEDIKRSRQKCSINWQKDFGWKIVEKYRSEKDKRKINREEPTFKEFVNFVVNGECFKQPMYVQAYHHWIPVYWLTLPCGYNYTIFGKLETYTEDMKYIVRKFNLKRIEPLWRNSEGGDVQSYYKQINSDELRALYNYYELDFLIFNYTYHPFPSYLGHSTLEYQYDYID